MAKENSETSTIETNKLYQQVKDRADLVDFIERRCGISPKRTGKTVRFNPCPFCGHNDCFSVLGDRLDGYKCYSCDATGDVFTFAERYDNLPKGKALRAVADAFGVTLPAPKAQQDPRSEPAGPNPLQAVLEAAVLHYRDVLSKRPESKTYLTTAKPDGRGHNDKTIDAMEIGFTDGKLAEALQKKGIPLDQITQAGLYVERQKDGQPPQWKDFFVPGVFIYPHRTELGDIGHFTIKDPRKKIDYQLRTENRLNGLQWGNQRAIHHDTVILVEGENDLASFLDVGIRNVMATLGQLSEQQIQWLLTHSNGKHFIIWFDYDTKYGTNGQPPAGIKYTRKLYNHLLRQPDCKVSVASAWMTPGEDPDDWIQKDKDTAPKRIQSIIKKAHHPLLWELKVLPPDVRDDASATLNHLEEISYFELLGLVADLQRDAIVLEMQKIGFSRDAVLENIKTGYGLLDQIEDIEEKWNVGANRSKLPEGFMREVAKCIWDHFKSHGKFFVSNDILHLFYHHKIYSIGGNTAWEALLHKEAQLNSTQQLAKFVNAEIKSLCYNRGDRLEAFSWVHMLDDGTGPTVYLNLKDPANRIMKLSANNTELMENGTNPHAVLLAESSQMKEFVFDSEVNVAAGMRDLKALFFDVLTCEPAQRYLVMAWTLAAYLLPITQTRPLMKMEGGSGSGKTTAARFCSLLLYGADMVGRSSTAGDYSMGSTEPLIIKDNLETDDINKQSLNFLLLAATGATNIKRKHGTESGITAEKLACLVCITAIEPFSKPELINRTYIIEFSKRFQNNEFVETSTSMKLLGRRNEIMSAWLQVLADDVLPDLAKRETYIKYIREQHRQFSKDRTSEFMALLTLLAKALLKYIPLPEELKIDAGDRAPEFVLLDEWIRYQDTHAKQSEQGTNAVLQLLEGLRRVFLIDFSRQAEAADNKVWCSMMGMEVEREAIKDEAGDNTGRQVYWFLASTGELLAMMQRYGREYGIKVPFQNAKQLGVRINNELHTIEAAGWKVTHRKVIHGTRYAEFSWRDE
ncbi:MAG: CHC2 zinc finger domain-containing protein [Gammaproteobacteria bacterium]|nr:CHC2 zinc finger domain-containing protein [Gammaproteobacteria bacterium]